MNLTPEELQFFRAQRLAASTEAIAFNHALCGQLLAVIPATQQPGPSFPVPLATMTHMELNAWKDLLVQLFAAKIVTLKCCRSLQTGNRTLWPLPLHRQPYPTTKKPMLS